MTKFKISEDGKHITVWTPFGQMSDTFELGDFVPHGYLIWNIGENMPDGYLPLCRLAARQPFPGGRSIEPDTLKAIKCEGAQTILSAIGYGPDTKDAIVQYIDKHSSAEPGSRYYIPVQRMKAALPYLEKIKW